MKATSGNKAIQQDLANYWSVVQKERSGTASPPLRSRSGVDPRIVAYCDPLSNAAEQYRALRTNILALDREDPPRALVVTSAVRGEGKSITSTNLAVALASEPNKKVALIDCDMRRPMIHQLLGLDNSQGLANLLIGDLPVEPALENGKIRNLAVLTSGMEPLKPSELLNSGRMLKLIGELKGKFDYVIFDTPPIISVTDAGVLGALVDGVLMVVRIGATSRQVVTRALSLLKAARAKALGCILTDIRYYIPSYIYRYI